MFSIKYYNTTTVTRVCQRFRLTNAILQTWTNTIQRFEKLV